LHNKRTTGLTQEQFNTLATALNQHLTWNKPAVRPRALSLNQALKITLLYLRHNSTEEDLADRFSVSQPTISRTIHRIENALLELEELKTPELESLKKYTRLTRSRRHPHTGLELGFTREHTVLRQT